VKLINIKFNKPERWFIYMTENNSTTWLLSPDLILTESTDEDGEKVFKRDDIILKKEDDTGNTDMYDFQIRIKELVSQFVNRSFEKIILLAGSGSSVTGDQNNVLGKTMADLVSSVISELESNSSYFNIEEICIMIKYPFFHQEGKVDSSRINLENLLSTIYRFEPFVLVKKEKKYQRTKKRILEVIKNETSYDYDQELLKHTSVINSLSNRVKAPYKLSVVTTNYDTMFEQAADEIDYTVIDGFTHSLDPYFNADEFEWNLVKNISNVKTKELEYRPNTIDLLKIHGSLTWEREENKIFRRTKNIVDKPILIFPSSNKYAQSYEEPYFDLFAKFQELLSKNNTLLITTGFSFGDSHITTMVERAVKRNQGICMLVTDFNIDQNGEGWQTIKKLTDSKFPVLFLKASFNNLPDYLG